MCAFVVEVHSNTRLLIAVYDTGACSELFRNTRDETGQSRHAQTVASTEESLCVGDENTYRSFCVLLAIHPDVDEFGRALLQRGSTPGRMAYVLGTRLNPNGEIETIQGKNQSRRVVYPIGDGRKKEGRSTIFCDWSAKLY